MSINRIQPSSSINISPRDSLKTFLELSPRELFEMIASFLGLASLHNLAMTSKTLNERTIEFMRSALHKYGRGAEKTLNIARDALRNPPQPRPLQPANPTLLRNMLLDMRACLSFSGGQLPHKAPQFLRDIVLLGIAVGHIRALIKDAHTSEVLFAAFAQFLIPGGGQTELDQILIAMDTPPYNYRPLLFADIPQATNYPCILIESLIACGYLKAAFVLSQKIQKECFKNYMLEMIALHLANQGKIQKAEFVAKQILDPDLQKIILLSFNRNESNLDVPTILTTSRKLREPMHWQETLPLLKDISKTLARHGNLTDAILVVREIFDRDAQCSDVYIQRLSRHVIDILNILIHKQHDVSGALSIVDNIDERLKMRAYKHIVSTLSQLGDVEGALSATRKCSEYALSYTQNILNMQ